MDRPLLRDQELAEGLDWTMVGMEGLSYPLGFDIGRSERGIQEDRLEKG